MELQLGEFAALKDVDVTGRILTVTLDVRRSALNKVLFWLSLICELPFAHCTPLIFLPLALCAAVADLFLLPLP